MSREPDKVGKDELMFAVMDIGIALGITDDPDAILVELVQSKLLELFPSFDDQGTA